MSDYNIKTKDRVTTWHSVQCDDKRSGFIEVAKTRHEMGSNAMTVTIKPLYGEPFTVNADTLRAAIDMALHDAPRDLDKEVIRRQWLWDRQDQLRVGDRVAVDLNGRRDWRRNCTVVGVGYYVDLVVDQTDGEISEGCPQQRIRVPRRDIPVVYDRDGGDRS